MIKKIVITGGSGAGKSSVVEMIKNKGYRVECEVAREVLDELRRDGYENPHKKNRDFFQREVLRRQLKKERELIDFEGTIFLDRGIVDNLAYYRLDGIEPPEYLKFLASKIRYDHIFYLELIPKSKLWNRDIDDKERIYIEHLILEEYSKYGYNPIKVPELIPNERVNIIFKELGL